MSERKPLTTAQKTVLTAAFLPMVATGVIGGIGTFSNIGHAYGRGTALGALAAGEGATAVLAIVLLGLTMLGQSSPRIIRIGLWALPAAASVMAAMAGPDPGRTVIYAVTPMGMCVSAEGMAFLARRIVVHTDGRDAEAEARAAAVVRELAYQRAVAANHPDAKTRKKADKASWQLAAKVGHGDHALSLRLLDVQRERFTTGADAALAAMFATPTALQDGPPVNSIETTPPEGPALTANQDEIQQADANQSTLEVRESPLPDPAPVDGERADSEAAARERVLSSLGLPIEPPAPVPPRPRRRPTGRVPAAARSPRPTRTADELLTEARKATADWADEELTAEAIRKAVRTAPAKARTLRDTLKAERAERDTDADTGARPAAA
ncbi:conjugal transfer protein [Streptomyces sp. NPDC020800]|uniref:conjugal transfer protein n=1 Tax=Streptomyces sp. NPDC020800 TaxID=3365092 RepID=UPI0037AE00D5